MFFLNFVSRQEEEIQILRSARGKLIALKNEPNNCPPFFKGKKDLVHFFLMIGPN